MKKLYLLFVAVVAVLAFAFINPQSVKADSATVATVDGASIRTTDPMGLRFAGQVTGEFTGGTISYGFLVSKGEFNKDEMLGLAAASKAVEVVAGSELDGEGRFYASIVNIPSSGYEQKITVVAYVEVDGIKTYAQTSATRDIAYVASQLATVDEYKDLAFVKKINNSSSFVLNGGTFVSNVEAKVGKYAGGAGGDSGITLGAKGGAFSNYYWSRIFIKATSINSKVYEIVHYEPGDGKVSNANVAVDYDYILAGHSNTAGAYEAVAAMKDYQYVYISALADGADIKVGNNVDILLNGKVLLEDGDGLPTASKTYYTFDGWFDNAGLTGDAVLAKAGNDAETFYAKYTPINYTLSFDLQGGHSIANTDDALFNVESATIVLPAEDTMERDDYNFVCWNTKADGTGTVLTSIAAGSHGDITVYAIWESIIPTLVVLTDADTAVISSIEPDFFVSEDFIAGRFSINGETYEVGTELFSTLAAAISAASAGKKIYLFAGTYTTDIVSLNKNVTIAGPNYGVHTNVAAGELESIRVPEAVIHNTRFNCSGAFTFDGVKLTGTTCFNYYGTGITIRNCVSTATGRKLYSNSEVIQLGGNATNVNIQYNHFTLTGSARPIRCESWTATNFVFSNNYVKNTTNVYDLIRVKTFAGTCEINNNHFESVCSNWLLYAMTSIAGCKFDFKDNYFKGLGTNYSGFGIYGFSDTTELNIIGNKFENVTGTVIGLGKDADISVNATINLTYNQFLGNAKLNIKSSSSNLTVTKNYASVAYENVGSYTVTGAGDFASAAELEAEYAGLS